MLITPATSEYPARKNPVHIDTIQLVALMYIYCDLFAL